MSLIETVAPSTSIYAVSVAEVKSNSNITHTDDDALIPVFIQAATEFAERKTGFHVLSRTYTYSLNSFPSEILLPGGPVIDVTSITYQDRTISPYTQTLATTVYELDLGCKPAVIRLQYDQTWPSHSAVTNGITVTYRTGLVDTDDSPIVMTTLPPMIKQGILMVASDLYENRELQSSMELYENRAAEMMFSLERNYRL